MPEIEKTSSEEPLYNIGVVTRATGVPITTLHAWERRYGFPHSSRTIGGHRLYTDKDISLLRWVKAQVDAGLATHQAIRTAQRLENEGKTPPVENSLPVRAAASLIPLPELRQQLRSALYQNELGHADQVLGDMLAFYSPEELTLNVIGPILYEIGESWEAGEISVATEHLASNYLRQRLLMWMVSGPRPKPANPIVLACAPGEWHDGSLLMLGVLLRRQGWPVAYLGQNVPFADLADFSTQIHPAAILLVAMRSEPATAMVDWPNWIKLENNRPLIAFGGRAFVVHPELKQLVPGFYLGDSISEGVEKLTEQLEKKMF
jgi:MerR family transcriptional regulator, light-induced transcriptional regulator